MIREILKTDEKDYIEMVKDFYSSPAVLHSIPESFIKNTFNQLMQSKTYVTCYIMQTDNNEIIGYALLVKTFTQEAGGNVIWLDEFYIKSKYRGKGYGSEFLTFLTTKLPAMRYRLEVEPDNESAKKLYSRFGFTKLNYEQMVKENS